MLSTIVPMPINPAPEPAGIIFLTGTTLILIGMMIRWYMAGEYKNHGFVLPLIFIGTGFSAIMVEPIFDNTLLYWYPAENPLSVFSAYERTIPWFVPLGYAWFFGGTAYLLQRFFASGVSKTQIWQLFAFVIFTDWIAVSICEWLDLSAFYGNQPYHWFGSPIWFSFCDATGAFVLAGALHLLLPQLKGCKQLWLLILPTFTYGATLGSATAPVSLALNSDWSTPMVWLCGTATMLMCCIAVYTVTQFAANDK